MASVTTGTGAAVFKDAQTTFDPQVGWQTVLTWTGSKSGVQAQSELMRTAGWKVVESHKGAFWQCVASNAFQADSSGNPSNDVAVDRWRISTGFAQLDLRNNPKLLAAAVTTDTLALWTKDIDDAIRAGVGLTGTVSTEEQALYDLKARGADAYEIRRPTLSRVRTISTSYPTPFIMDAVEKVWPTAALVSAFDIPANIVARLPADPAPTPTGTVWAWKLTRQDSDIILATNRVEENHEWVFAAWSTLLYDIAS